MNKKTAIILAVSLIAIIAMGGSTIAFAQEGSPITNECGILDGIGCFLGNLLTAVIQAVSMLLSALVAFLAWAIDWMIKFSVRIPYLSVVQTGFRVSLSVVNILFVMAIIIAAFRLILGFSNTHETNSFIKNLIIAAILVNFSLLIAGLLLDVTNVFVRFFIDGVAPDNIASAFDIQKLKAGNPVLTGTWFDDFINIVAASLVQVVLTLIVLIALISIFIMVTVRNVYLAFLLVTMPLIWGFWVFPSMREHWERWWKEFMNWGVTFLPTATFFIWLVVTTANNLGSEVPTKLGPPGADGFSGFLYGLFGFIIQNIILVGLILFGLKQAASAGATGASLAVNTAGKIGKTVGLRAGRALYRGTGAETAVSKTAKVGSNFASNLAAGQLFGGRLGALQRGFGAAVGAQSAAGALASASKRTDLVEEEKKKYESLSAEQAHTVATTPVPVTDVEAVARLEFLADHDALDEIPEANLEKYAAAVTRLNPGQKAEKIEVLKKLAEAHPGMAKQITGQTKSEVLSKMTGDALKKISKNELKNLDTLGSLSKSQLTTAARASGEREAIINETLTDVIKNETAPELKTMVGLLKNFDTELQKAKEVEKRLGNQNSPEAQATRAEIRRLTANRAAVISTISDDVKLRSKLSSAGVDAIDKIAHLAANVGSIDAMASGPKSKKNKEDHGPKSSPPPSSPPPSGSSSSGGGASGGGGGH